MGATEKPKGKRTYGRGSVYLREGSRVYIMAYFDSTQNKKVRESTGETSIKRAKKVLDDRLDEISSGKYLGPAAERTTIEELAHDLLVGYATGTATKHGEKVKDIANPTIRWEKHLKPVFGHLKAKEVTRPVIDRYVSVRLKDGASNGSINRELAFLKRCFRLGLEHEKLYRVPTFPHLAEDNIREGFPTDEQFEKLKTECAKEGLWMRAMLELAATFGWRKGSLLKMRASNVDLVRGTVRQEASTTKSGEANECKMTNGLKTLLTACAAGKDADRWLFSRDVEGWRPIRDFRRTWRKVTKTAGVPKLLFHDLCRFAARGLDTAGISQIVGMQVMGRKTPSIYKRYRIVDRRDVDRAIDRLEESKAQTKVENQIDSHLDSHLRVGNA
jgi:integrase